MIPALFRVLHARAPAPLIERRNLNIMPENQKFRNNLRRNVTSVKQQNIPHVGLKTMGAIKRTAEEARNPAKRMKFSKDPGNAPFHKKSAPAAESRPRTSNLSALPSETDEDKKRRRSAQSSVLKEEERAFPRGGASVLTPLEHKQIKIQAEKDVLFEQAGKHKVAQDGDSELEDVVSKTKIPEAKKPKSKGKDSKAEAASKQEEPQLRTEGLSYRRLFPGSIVLGQVTQITARDVSLALPNNLTGYIPVTAVSDKLNQRIEALLAEDGAKEEDVDGPADGDDIDLKKLFHIGQYLRAYATSTVDDTSANGSSKAKRRIELSVNPRQANNGIAKSSLVANSMIQASVVSVEDHGLVMDLGLEDETVKGFLSSKELGHKIDHSRIEEGAVFLCMITGLNQNGNIVKLSADYLKIGNIKKSHFLTEAPTVDVFLPGTAVEILTTEVSSSGVAGKIMGLLDATADFTHSGAGESIKNIESRYKIGSKIKARVICTFPNMDQPRVGISMLGHVLALSHRTSLDGDVEKDPLQKLALSATVGSAKVVKVQPRIGLFLDLGVKGVLGYAHISRLADKKVENLSQTSGPYQLDSTHRARVIGYNPVDGLYIVSLEPKILDQPFLRIEDIEVGQIVKGKVERLILNANGVGGVLVNLAEGISGLVPEMHLADVHLQHPEKKFREGVTVTARVLSTDPEKRQIRLTLKKTLVNSQSTIWKDYSAISVGDQSPGTLINILPAGAVVQFYGTVRGFLPVSEMSEAYIQDPAEHFRLGQVVNVHVLSVNSEKGKMTVTCKDPAAFNLAQQTALKELKPGAFVNASVTEKTNDTINVEIETSGLKAIIHLEQLTDGSEQKNLSAMKRIRVGQKLQDLVLIEKVEKRHLVVLTNKPSLVGAAKAGTLLATFSDVKEGQKAPGFVRNVTPESVYVQFAGGLVGLLLKSQLSADIAKLPAYGLRKGQSISTRVLSVDHAQQRFLLTMRDDAPKTEQKSKPASAALIEVLDPVDGTSTSIEDFTIGKLTKARITAIKDTQLNVQLAENLQGRIDVSEVFNKWEEINDRKHPLRKFKPKQIISVRILGIHDARNHRFLPITHRQGRVPVFELSAKTKIQLESEADVLTLDKVSPGSTWIAYVNNIADSCLWVNISPNVRGRVELMDLSDDVSLLGNLEENFPVGSAIRVHVKKVDPSANRLDLSAIKTSSTGPLTLQSISKGMILPGRVTKVTERSVMVQLSDSISGPVTLTELTDDYSRANPTIHKKNEVLRVCIVDVDAPNKKLTLSTRPSKVLSSSLPVKDPQILSLSQLKVNDVVRGFVKNVADQGLFVSLGPSVTAFVRVSDLSDAYIKDWKSSFEVDQLVRGKILNVDVPLNHVQMSLKASIMDENYVPPITFSDLKPGQILTGKVRKVEDFGAFIDVDNSIRVSGLCHRSEIADQRVQDVRKVYEEGDVVKAVVLEVDTEKRRVSFGLKASYFKDAASDGESGDEESDSDVGGAEPEAVASEDDDETEDSGVDLDDVQSIDAAEEVSEASDDEMGIDRAPVKPVNGLSTGGFDWTGASVAQDKAGAGDESDAESRKVTKKKKRRNPEIKVDKTGDLDKYGPQSVADFERQLLGQPNSSLLWLQYMEFQIKLSEVDKARDIAERALKTIHIREEEEKMNVWTALLNLEIEFGSDSSVEEVFKRACQYNDAQEMHRKLANSYIVTGRHQKADEVFQNMTKIKAFTADPKTWLEYASFLFTKLADPARARALLPRATQSVPQHAHRQLTEDFARLEFSSPNGDAERGRTIYEGLLSTFPKRRDIWERLINIEEAKGERENVRRLYGRLTGMGIKSRWAKDVFKKWLLFEEKGGDAKAVEHVKAKAAEFVAAQK